jgi:DNA-binding NtrC family response regulator
LAAATLLIDDEEDVLSSIKALFAQRKLGIDVAASWDQALALFRVALHELVIADYNLKDSKHGLTLLDSARALNPSTQLILISGWVSEETAQQAKDAGFVDAFYPKTSELPAILANLAADAEVRMSTPTRWKRHARARLTQRRRDEKELVRIDDILRSQLPEK